VRLALLEAGRQPERRPRLRRGRQRDALGAEVLRSLTPEQHFVRLVHRELTRLLGERPAGLDLGGPTPVIIKLVGLNGSGKTTTTAKLARWLATERGRTPYSSPPTLPAGPRFAQLETLAREARAAGPSGSAGGDAVAIAREGVATRARARRDAVLVDTRRAADVERRADGRARAHGGGARAAPGAPRRRRHDRAGRGRDGPRACAGGSRSPASCSPRSRATRAAVRRSRCAPSPASRSCSQARARSWTRSSPSTRSASLRASSAMGDVLSLIERAEKAYEHSQAEALQKKLRRNEFDLEDIRAQLRAVRKMGAVSEAARMIPGVKKMLRGAGPLGRRGRAQARRGDHRLDDARRAAERPAAERQPPQAIARGSGTSVADVNRLVKQFTQTKKVLKRLGSDR